MKDSALTLLTGIEYKTRLLLEKKQQLQIENKELLMTIASKDEIIKTLESKLKDNQARITLLKLTKNITKEDKQTDVKLKINKLIREIDYCIGKLSI